MYTTTSLAISHTLYVLRSKFTMAVPHLLAVIFSTTSVANGLSEVWQFDTYLSEDESLKGQERGAATLLPTFPQFLRAYTGTADKYHTFCHGSTLLSLTWSLVSIQNARIVISTALAFEVASLVLRISRLLPLVTAVKTANTKSDIEIGIQQIIRTQVVRNFTTHLPCMLCCFYAVMAQ